jgi:hypothetical protein
MLTIFTTPKPFIGHDNIIQTNAIKSWTLLQPACEIILMGKDAGIHEVSSRMGVKHYPDIECNEYGTPLLSSIFFTAQKMTNSELMCYINADIILMSDFLPAVEKLVHGIKKRKYLMVGQRWDLDIDELLDFDRIGWEKELRLRLKNNGQLHPKTGIDYFLYSKGLFNDIPPFAIGRTFWDNWLIYRARKCGASVIDASEVVTAIHQNHDYSHTIQGYSGVWKGPEALKNRELAGNGKQVFPLEYATLKLTKRGIKPILSLRHLYFGILALPVLYPRLKSFERPLAVFTKIVSKIRIMLK